MKKLFQILFLIATVSVVFMSSCKESTSDDPSVKAEYQILSEYLVSSGLDIDKVMTSTTGSKFVYAPATAADVDGKYVIDIRSGDDFVKGHIAGAVNVPVGSILTEAANAGDKQILVACYTGQTACYATALLRLYGYPETQALKWGMSGWSATTDKWTANIGDSGEGKLSTDAAPDNVEYANPTINTGKTDGQSILKARVEAVIAEWSNATVSGTNVVTSPTDYFINNYFSADHYVGFGHVAGAYRVNPLTLASGSVNFLDPSKPIVTYCYTGQTSAVVTAYLRVLGFDAKSMLFGMNGLNHSNGLWSSGPVTNHWGSDSNPKDFPLAQ